MGWRDLSFGDRLNVSLFVLTITAVFLAGWSLRVAQLTLDDAKRTGCEQKKQFDQQSEQSKTRFEDERTRSQEQFKQQMQTAEKSRSALVQAEGRLRQEGVLLTRMQETSKLQLGFLDQQTKLQMEYAEGALPALRVECEGASTFMTVLEINAAGVRIWPKTEREPLKADKDGLIYCRADVSNGGRIDLKDARLEVNAEGTDSLLTEDLRPDWENTWVRVAIETQMAVDKSFSPKLFHDSAVLLSEPSIAPTGLTQQPKEAHFTILIASRVTEFTLRLELDSSNARQVSLRGPMKVVREK